MSFDLDKWLPVFWVSYISIGVIFLFFLDDPHKKIMIGISMLLGFIALHHHQVMRAITKRVWTI